MTKLLLVLMALSTLLGGNIWLQADPEVFHFQSCDQRIKFDYPADFTLQENGVDSADAFVSGLFDYYQRSIYLQYDPTGENIASLHTPIHLDITLNNNYLRLGNEVPEELMLDRLNSRHMERIREVEIAGLSGMIGYTSSPDTFLLQLYLGDDFLLNFDAIADDTISIDILEETAEVIAQTLEFETQYPDGGGVEFFFSTNCALSLFYPDAWGNEMYRHRYLFYNSADAQYAYVSRQPIGEDNLLIEVMPHEEILSYFEIAEDEANVEDVLRSFMTVRDLLPYEVPQLESDDIGRNLLKVHHAGGLVTVLEIDGELTIIALYTGGDIDDYAEEYWSMIDSIRLHGREEGNVIESAGERQ